jgi:hypothetical protein
LALVFEPVDYERSLFLGQEASGLRKVEKREEGNTRNNNRDNACKLWSEIPDKGL